MRSLLMTLVVFAWAVPGLAAQTFTVPFTVVPGSVSVWNPQSGLFEPVTMPFSEVIQSNDPNCSFGLGTVSVEVINGGLEIELDGAAVSNGNTCGLLAKVELTIEVEVPELGGTATMIRWDVTGVGNFSVLDRALSSLRIEAGPTSSIPGGLYYPGEFSSGLAWLELGEPAVRDNWVTPGIFIPGDTLQLPVRLNISFSSLIDPTQGTARARYEFKITVPEPSAALSLPIGVLCLAGLASMRGSG